MGEMMKGLVGATSSSLLEEEAEQEKKMKVDSSDDYNWSWN